jgi:ABC-type sugar transport system substrate-binding protein
VSWLRSLTCVRAHAVVAAAAAAVVVAAAAAAAAEYYIGWSELVGFNQTLWAPAHNEARAAPLSMLASGEIEDVELSAAQRQRRWQLSTSHK